MSALNTISDQFEMLVRNLVKGNMKKALKIAGRASNESLIYGMNVCMQDVIEDLANEQALKNGMVNLPSIFPGIGTIISFLLLGSENLLILEQGVRLALVLLLMNGRKPDDANLEEMIIIILGQAYGLAEPDENTDFHAITKEYITKVLPPKYLTKGVNKIVSRIFPSRSRLMKLVPVLGVFYAAFEGYSMTVKVGQTTLKLIKKNKL